MEIKDINKEMTIIINEKTYKKHKQELDKIGCHVIQANFVKLDKIQIIKGE